MKPRLVLWVPLALFLLIAGISLYGLLRPGDGRVQSRMVGQPIPALTLPPALPGRPALAPADYSAGQPRLINIFASWCVPCIAEAPQLVQIARAGVAIDAVAIRDRPEDIANFLQRWGDPYRSIALDNESSLQLALGSSGVPETFIVDGRGIIRYQHIGAIMEQDVPTILREYEAARR